MKKIGILVLMLAVLVYITEGLVIYELRLCEIRQQMKGYVCTHLDDPMAARFALSASNGVVGDQTFHWEEDGREFELNGEYFDVISLRSEKDSLHIVCIKDMDEAGLRNAYADWQRRSGDGGAKEKGYVKALSDEFVPQEIFEIVLFIGKEVSQLPGYSVRVPVGYPDVPSNPPWPMRDHIGSKQFVSPLIHGHEVFIFHYFLHWFYKVASSGSSQGSKV